MSGYLLWSILEINLWDHVQFVVVQKTLIFPIKGTIETISQVALPWATKERKRADSPILLRGTVLPDRAFPVSEYNASRVPSGKWARLSRSLIGKLRIASCGRWMPATKPRWRRGCTRKEIEKDISRVPSKKNIPYIYLLSTKWIIKINVIRC